MTSRHSLTLIAILILSAVLTAGPRPSAAPPPKPTLQSLQANPGESNFFSSVVDPVNGFVYFGTNTSPCRVVKVDVKDFTHTDTLTIPSSTNCGVLSTAAIHTQTGHAYFGLGNINSGSIFKIDLATFSLVGTLRLSSGVPFSSVISGDYLYVGTSPGSGRSDQGEIHKIDLASFTEVAILYLDHGDLFPGFATVDLQNQVAFFAVGSSSTVIKIDLVSFTVVGTLRITNSTSLFLRGLAFDPLNQRLYAGLVGDPNNIYEIDSASLTVIGPLRRLPQARHGIAFLAIAPLDGVLFASYFGEEGGCSGTEVAVIDLQNGKSRRIRKITPHGLGPFAIDDSTGAAYVGDIFCQQLTTAGNVFEILPNQ
jgi:hypothetical protein